MIILSTLGVIRQQVELVFQHESDLQDTVDWGRKRFVNFNARKT